MADYVAPRTCTIVNEGEAGGNTNKGAAPLSSYANASAYVLIAEPGSGKTTSFKAEAASQGGAYVTVRDFLTFDDHPDWHDVTLFLDGLDESRAGTEDGRTPLNDIRRKLDHLGRPPFRLSCRWADWMAANDKEALRGRFARTASSQCSGWSRCQSGTSRTYSPTTTAWKIPDGFIRGGEEGEVWTRLLDKSSESRPMLAKSVSRGQIGRIPARRPLTRPAGCSRANQTVSIWIANPLSVDVGPLIEAAGRLCAVQLFAGVAGYTLPDRAEPDTATIPPSRRPTEELRDVMARDALCEHDYS